MNYFKVASQENDLETFVEVFTEEGQSAYKKTFKTISTRKKTKQKISFTWWTERIAIMRKKTNALGRLYQRTRNNETMESRKHKYFEEKLKYQYEIKGKFK